MRFLLGALLSAALTWSASGQTTAQMHLVEQAPESITEVASGIFLVDFGRVAYGNLSLTLLKAQAPAADAIHVRFGEALTDGRVNRHPPGAVRYAEVEVATHGAGTWIVAPLANARNTQSTAVRTQSSWGVLLPFRWVEVEGWPTELDTSQIRRRAAFDATWSDNAASFHSSDPLLDRIWDLSHYSVQATTFAGIFVDGDRERRPYEADAYLNQLDYYQGDTDPRMPRATFEYLMQHPTWPSEWGPQMIFMAYADWMETGDEAWLRSHYDWLKTKLMSDRVRPDGLVTSSAEQIKHEDIVDWPPAERDGFVFTPMNSVVNAVHLRALEEMSELARALGRDEEARQYLAQLNAGRASFEQVFFDPVHGLYRDGVGTEHTSEHANLFALSFGLVPGAHRRHVAEWLAARGMAVSIYAAQYLLEGLFEAGQAAAALDLITGPGDRSWRHMVESGTTITWEAWDQKYKPNQDWNHIWGAAPANLLPRFVLGARPQTPGWTTASIQPHPGNLLHAEGRIPTPRGELGVSWRREGSFVLQLRLPPGMKASVELPASPGAREVRLDGKRVKAERRGTWWVLKDKVSGNVEIDER